MVEASGMEPWLQTGKRLLLAVGLLWLSVFALLYLLQRHLLYVPPAGTTGPTEAGLTNVDVRQLVAPDGATIAVWSMAAPAGRPTVLYFHGNGGSLGLLAPKYQLLRDAGFGVYATTYRGYPGSTGRPSEAAIITDAVMAYDDLRSSGVPADRIVLYGESLGSGVAIQVAAQRPVAAIVLESPYSSIADVAAEAYWFVPARFALADHFDSVHHVAGVRAPILILHGTLDPVVPIRFAHRLHDAIPGRKKFVTYEGAGHIGLLRLGGLAQMTSFVDSALRERQAETK
jgi:fermentation-respiration switch protein FrsA (DUF1100 family)